MLHKNLSQSQLSVIDDFLPDDIFSSMRERMLSNSFPWYFYPYRTYEDRDGGIHDCQMNHTFYQDEAWNSDAHWAVDPVLSIVDPKVIVRIKANLTFPADSVKDCGMHTDFDNSLITTGILYLTETDGGTVFADGEFVESVPNRFAYFNATKAHSAQTFTNAKVRCVINFNFVL